jgi:alpha-tubulin suppressor-like RCC1 family protein
MEIDCWGAGYLGNGFRDVASSTVSVKGIADATGVSVSEGSSCALVSSGKVYCWGEGGVGELGDGHASDSATPVAVSGISNAISVSGGLSDACALLSDGHVDCWGYNGGGAGAGGVLGVTGGPEMCSVSVLFACSRTPVRINPIENAIAIGVGAYYACAVISGGAVKCWGADEFGQLGDGPEGESSSTPKAVAISAADAIAVGDNGACARLVTGAVECWGEGGVGELGNGTSPAVGGPVGVSGISEASTLAATFGHACSTLAGGVVECWGENLSGQLGTGAVTGPETCEPSVFPFPCSRTPAAVEELSAAVEVAVGEQFSCALLEDGSVKCWGDDASGQLGDGGHEISPRPVHVHGIG